MFLNKRNLLYQKEEKIIINRASSLHINKKFLFPMSASVDNLLPFVQCAGICAVHYMELSLKTSLQSLNCLVMGLKVVALSIKSHSTSKSVWLSFRSHTWAANLVLILLSGFLMSALWPYHLSLKVLPVIPVYVSALPDTVSVAL